MFVYIPQTTVFDFADFCFFLLPSSSSSILYSGVKLFYLSLFYLLICRMKTTDIYSLPICQSIYLPIYQSVNKLCHKHVFIHLSKHLLLCLCLTIEIRPFQVNARCNEYATFTALTSPPSGFTFTDPCHVVARGVVVAFTYL